MPVRCIELAGWPRFGGAPGVYPVSVSSTLLSVTDIRFVG